MASGPPAPVPEEENAAEGVLGEFFSAQPVVTNAEVQILLEQYTNEKKGFTTDWQPPPMFTKVQEYVQRFTTVKNKETAQQVRDVIVQYNLTDFELGAIANLMPETADEAKALVPSLVAYGRSDEEIQEMLDDLNQFKRFE